MHPITLARLRSMAGQFLTGRCTISRPSVSVGAYGDSQQVWAVVANDIPCRLVYARRSDLSAAGVTAGRETLEFVYRLVLPHGTSLQAGDRIEIGGEVYGIVRLDTALSDALFVSAIIARR